MTPISERYMLLLPVLAVLLAAKFIVVPLSEYQDALKNKTEQAYKRAAKGELAINAREPNETLKNAKAAEQQALTKLFFSAEAEADFKLMIQQQVEKIASQHDIGISNFGWGFSGSVSQAPVIRHMMKFSFSGKTLDLMKFHLALESQEKAFNLVRFTYTTDKQRAGALGNLRGTIEAAVYQLSPDAAFSGAGGSDNE